MEQQDTNIQEITVEDVDTRWPFRAGYPRLLREPVSSYAIIHNHLKPFTEANFPPLKRRIREILSAHNLRGSYNEVQMAYRVQLYNKLRRREDNIRVIVHCTYDKDTSNSKLWAKAVTEIYREIRIAAGQDKHVGVELYDMGYMGTRRVCEPPADQEFCKNWQQGHNYRRQILQLFENHPETYQAMFPIGVRAISEHTYDYITAIYFDALNADDDMWDGLEEAIRAILPNNIGVEIRQSAGSLLSQDSIPEHPRSWDVRFSSYDYDRPPNLGCEISVQGNSSASATMGGYVMTKARDTNERTTFGVTSAHVVLGHEETTITLQNPRDIRVQAPSEKTRWYHEAILSRYLPRREKEDSETIDSIEAVKEIKPDYAKRLGEILTRSQAETSEIKDSLQSAQRDPYIGSVQNAKLGHVNYSMAPDQNKLIMDIALIKVESLENVHPKNILLKHPREAEWIRPDAKCSTWEVDGLGSPQDADKHIKVVGKVSRQGKYSLGIVGDFKADIEFPLYINGEKVIQKLCAWAITKPYPYDASKPIGSNQNLNDIDHRLRYPFSISGDSGSFVIASSAWRISEYDNKIPGLRGIPWKGKYVPLFDSVEEDPFIVGMLCGTSCQGDVSYFIPIDVLKAEIESLTGEEMVWPKRRSECLPQWERGDDDVD